MKPSAGIHKTGRNDLTIQVIPTKEYFNIIKKELKENGQAFVRVTGRSMEPLLKHMRDRVKIIPPEKIRWGDIVLFERNNGRYALHRVISKGSKGFSMAGDNQWYFETNLPYNQVIGVVTDIDRNGKLISVKHIFIRMYKVLVTAIVFPRIYIWKAIQKLLRIIRHSGNQGQEGATE